jgi:hypothetical protein
VLTTYALVYRFVTTQKGGDKVIWVPPKPKATLPFGLGPPPEPIKIEDFEKTTYTEYEIKTLKDGAQGVCTSGGISFLMSMKFGPMSLLIQSIMMPLNLIESPVLKKHFLGTKTSSTGGTLYGELFEPPTAAIVDAMNVPIGGLTAEDEPRVEELTDEKEKKEEVKEEKKKLPKASAGADID